MNKDWIFRYTAYHLKKAERYEDLYHLLDEKWIQEQYAYFGTFATVLNDFDLAIQSALIEKPINWVQFFKSLFTQARINEVASNLPMEIIEYFINRGEYAVAPQGTVVNRATAF
jgi:hypothetical protein